MKKSPVSKSKRCGLSFSVARTLRYLKFSKIARAPRIAVSAAIYLTAVLEYMTNELIELSGNVAKSEKRKTITPRFVMLAAMSDSEIFKMLRNVTFPYSGVLPTLAPTISRHSRAAVSRNPPVALKMKQPTALCKTVLPNNKLLQVIQGDIAEMSVDAVVHPTSSNFYMGGMVGSRLLSKGGQAFANLMSHVSQSTPRMPYLAAHVTPAVNLNCKHVIHINGPTWNPAQPSERLADLERCVENCLIEASRNQFSSIAFPSVGSGRAGFPKAAAAETIVQKIKSFFSTAMDSSLIDVRFVLYDQESIDCYVFELKRTL